MTSEYPAATYSVTGSSADEYLCIQAGMSEEDACELACRESTTGRWGVVLVKRDATGITVATYAHGERRD